MDIEKIGRPLKFDKSDQGKTREVISIQSKIICQVRDESSMTTEVSIRTVRKIQNKSNVNGCKKAIIKQTKTPNKNKTNIE